MRTNNPQFELLLQENELLGQTVEQERHLLLKKGEKSDTK